MKTLSVLLLSAGILAASPAKKDKQEKAAELALTAKPVLWTQPTDISTRNLYFGPGGEADAPRGVFTFVKEDLDGTNPKFVVTDENGVKWKVKLGTEARPETAASRLVWAVGYRANEDYFLPTIQVNQLPATLHRGEDMRRPNGEFQNVRLKRYLKGEDKLEKWKWAENPFTGTRELNGLRVMMALLNNWDLKDENNSVYLEKHPKDSDGPEKVYLVSDLGATFGTNGLQGDHRIDKGDFIGYKNSKFIVKSDGPSVDFGTPGRPSTKYLLAPEYRGRLHIEWIGKQIPREDAKWIGGLLAQLSDAQLHDAFRGAGYTEGEVDAFVSVVKDRIAQLNSL